MKLSSKQASYGISYGQDNPYIFGIVCIIVSVALALPVIFLLCLNTGIIQMSPQSVIITIFMYAGALTIGIVLSMTFPKFKQAAKAVKITGKIVDFKSIINKNGHVYYPIVEYQYNGQNYTVQLDSWSSSQPSVGFEMEIRVNPKKPNKIVTKGELVFSIFALIIFTGAGILFGSIGFLINASDSQMEAKSFNFDSFGLIICCSFIAFWLLLGIIICVVTKKRHVKGKLKEIGIKKTAIILDVKINENVEINGENPVKLTCSLDGQTFILKTKTQSQKCKYRMGNIIDIYFDPNNEKKYFADLDS